jgi:tetratricopeptide (TPR) repeat protein
MPAVFGMVFLGGCVVDKQMVPAYQGKAQREIAMQQSGYEEPIVTNYTQTSPIPVESSRLQGQGQQILADDDLLLPILTHVNERIFSYEQKLVAWESLHEQAVSMNLEDPQLSAINSCGQQLQNILAQYNELHLQLLQKNSVTTKDLLSGNTLLRLDKLDLEFLESDCGKASTGDMIVNSGLLLPTGGSVTLQQKEEISVAYANGEYEKVLQEYERLQGNSVQEIPYDLTVAYGQALMKSGRESHARTVFQDLLARIRQNDQALWEFKLMQLIGDLDFALGTYEPAKDQYDEIVRIYEELSRNNDWAKQQLSALNVADEQKEEVKAYTDLLRSYLAYNADRDGFTVVRKGENFVSLYPYSLVASSADHLISISKQKAEDWYKKLMQKVNDLAAEERFQEALLVLERVPRTILPIEKQQELAAKSAELTTTEAITRETKELAEEQIVQENWNAGMSFLEFKEYDQAIEAFSHLLGTSYDARARDRINEAAGLAAQEDRRRAAELFVRSNRTHDLESRKKLLFSSRQLLQDILIKYPQSELVEKVKRNLQRIDEEIMAIDPSLLSAPVTVNGMLPEPVKPSVDSMFE